MRMDDEEFKQKLSQVAVWRQPEIKLDGPQRRKLATLERRKTYSTSFDQEEELENYRRFNGVQPTAAPELVELKFEPKPCEACDKTLDKMRLLTIRIIKGPGYSPHVRELCNSCVKYKDPQTGQFNIALPSAEPFFKRLYSDSRKKKDSDKDL